MITKFLLFVVCVLVGIGLYCEAYQAVVLGTPSWLTWLIAALFVYVLKLWLGAWMDAKMQAHVARLSPPPEQRAA